MNKRQNTATGFARYNPVLFVFLLLLSMGLWQTGAKAEESQPTFKAPPPTYFDVSAGVQAYSFAFQYMDNKSAEGDHSDRVGGLGFVGYGLYERFGIGMSAMYHRTQLWSSATKSFNSNKKAIQFFLMPVIWKAKKHQVSLFLGRGIKHVIETYYEEKPVDMMYYGDESSTGLLGRFFLSNFFSFTPWISFNYLLVDIFPDLQVGPWGTPSYGVDAVLHFSRFRVSFSMVLQTVSYLMGLRWDHESAKQRSFNIETSIELD